MDRKGRGVLYFLGVCETVCTHNSKIKPSQSLNLITGIIKNSSRVWDLFMSLVQKRYDNCKRVPRKNSQSPWVSHELFTVSIKM